MSSPATDESTLQHQLDELRDEVAQLRDKEAIRTVLDSYAFLLDTARWRDIAKAVFTEDAIDHHSPAMGPGAVPRGREEIGRFLDTTMRAFAGSQHMLGNSSITVDGDTARSRTYAACAHWRPSEPSDPNEPIDPSDPSAAPPRPSDLTVAVAYDDIWRRTSEGWRICERWVHTFGPHGLLAGNRSADLPRLGSDLYGSRDR